MINGINKNIKMQVYHIISWITLFFIKIRRKRSTSNILKDTVPSTLTSSTPNQPSTEDIKITTRKPRTKVQCFCSKCNGKLVVPRTKTAHEQKEQPISLDSLQSDQLTPLPTILPNETQITQVFNGNWGTFDTNNNRYQYVRGITFHLSSA